METQLESREILMQKYKDCLPMLGLEKWSAVEDKLGTDQAEKIVDLLVAYAEATALASESFQAWMGVTKKTHPIQKARWAAEEATNKVYLENQRKRQLANTELMIALVGKDEFYELKRAREEKENAFERALQEDLDGVYRD